MKTLRFVAVTTVFFAYLLVALSPIVRITESGMGCGDNWPLCNGRIIPTLDNLEVMIEWGHRLAAAAVSALALMLVVLAGLKRFEPGVGGPRGVLRPAILAAVLLLGQVLLGAITVWLELPPSVVVLHMSNAMALLAVLMVAALRSQASLTGQPWAEASGGAFRTAVAAAAMGGVALLLGALTANLGAGPACQGFPLCSGQLWPTGSSGLVHVHWTHRVVAYLLFLHMIAMVVIARRRGEPSQVRQAGWIALVILIAHVVVAATMVESMLPMSLRTAHAVLGAAVWAALVYLVWRSAPEKAPSRVS